MAQRPDGERYLMPSRETLEKKRSGGGTGTPSVPSSPGPSYFLMRAGSGSTHGQLAAPPASTAPYSDSFSLGPGAGSYGLGLGLGPADRRSSGHSVGLGGLGGTPSERYRPRSLLQEPDEAPEAEAAPEPKKSGGGPLKPVKNLLKFALNVTLLASSLLGGFYLYEKYVGKKSEEEIEDDLSAVSSKVSTVAHKAVVEPFTALEEKIDDHIRKTKNAEDYKTYDGVRTLSES